MKKRLILVLILVLSVSIAWSGETNKPASEVRAFFDKCVILEEEGKYEEALSLIDKGIKEYPDSRLHFIQGKYHLLMKLERYKEAVEVAVERDKLFGMKSPKKSMDVVRLYLKLKDAEKAIKWLEITTERGFQDYSELNKSDIFKPLRGDKRFDALIERIEARIGIGKPVKPFTGTSLSGKKVSPAGYKGKVLLIDFWATYCPPCVKGVPYLKKVYTRFKARGFEIIGINVDSDREKVEEFIQTEKIEWPTVFSGNGWEDETRKLYNLVNIPSYWLVDKKGILRYVGLEGEELGDAITRLQKEY